MANPKLLPLAVLRADGQQQVEGITRMQKLVFLAERELIDLGENEFYDFEPYDYGPFSKELYADLESLVEDGYVDEQEVRTPGGKTKQVYNLTEKGNALFNHLREDDGNLPIGSVENLKKEHNGTPLLQLIKHVYMKYPDMAINSKLDIV